MSEKDDIPTLPFGYGVEEEKPETKEEEKPVPEKDKMKEFFFPEQNNMMCCVCGVKFGSSSRHSDWCTMK